MKTQIKIVIALFFICIGLAAQNKQLFANVGNLPLDSGDTLFNCKVGYRLFGKLNEDSSNVIINPTWFAGTSEHLGRLMGEDKFIDTTNYFVIAVDAVGNGVSTSPSNYDLPFPKISMRDIVRAEYLLVTEKLGFKKLFAAIGGSMGSMQVFEWVVMYPGFVQKAVPYVCTPKSSTNDKLQWEFRKEMIESYREAGVGDGQIQKMIDMFTALSARTPDYLVESIDENKFDEYLAHFKPVPNEIFTIDDYYAQLLAMIDYNIYEPYGGSLLGTLPRIKSEMFLIVSANDHLLHPKASLEFADSTGSKILVLNNSCGHIAVSCELERCAKEIAQFLKE